MSLVFWGTIFLTTTLCCEKELNWIAKAWNIFLSAHCLPTKNMARVEYYRLRYIYAICRGYNVNLGKMIVNSLDHITQAYHAGGVGLSGIITHICAVNGIPGLPTDVYMISGRKVSSETLEKFSARPRHQDEMVVREEQKEAEHDDMNLGDKEEPPLHHPQQQPLPPPNMPRADQYDQNLGYIVHQNDYLISAMQHQFAVNAHFNSFRSGLADDINAMAARLNIGERVRRPGNLPEFTRIPPQNPYGDDGEEN